jgi:hypothetical protein
MKSPTFYFSMLNAIALGGMDMGMHIAAEELSAKGTTICAPAPMLNPMPKPTGTTSFRSLH